MRIHNAGVQLYSSNKPLVPKVELTEKKRDVKKEKKDFWLGKKSMKERKKELLKKKTFLDKKTVKYLEDLGLLKDK